MQKIAAIDASSNALVAAFDRRWQAYRKQYKAGRVDLTEQAVHDVRVSARRLLGALEVIGTFEARPRLRRTRRSLKQLLDDLDALRDAQVILLEVSKSPEPAPELSLFRAHLEKLQSRLLRRARARIKASKPSEMRGRIEKMRAGLAKETRRRAFNGNVLLAVDNLYLAAALAAAEIDAQQPASIHRARVAFKKFRYAAEMVESLLPVYPEDYFRRMHDHQSRMGDIRDIEILLAALAEFAAKQGSGIDAEPIRRTYVQRHADLVAAHLRDREQLKAFWRAAPEQSFPWENNHDPVSHSTRNRGGDRRSGSSARRQPARADRGGSPKDAPDRARATGARDPDRPDPVQPIPARQPDGRHPGEED